MEGNNKHLLAKIGQYAIIKNDAGKILVLQRARSKTWSLPGGRLHKKEECHKAFIREIKEETGLKVLKFKPIEVAVVTDSYQTKYCVYFDTEITNIKNLKISSEHSQFKWIDAKEIKRLKMEYKSLALILKKILNG